MTELRQRDIRVIAGPLTIEGRKASGEEQPILKMRFDITKTNSKDPNSAEISIWNLNSESRSALQEKGLEVVIEAGYADEVNQVFKGDLEEATITKGSVNWITSLELGDGSKQMGSARINDSFRGPQSMGQMIKKAAESLGLDIGNLDEKIRTDGNRSVLKTLISGAVLSGKSSDVLDKLAAAAGLNFSVQDKKLQFLGKDASGKDEVLPGPAIQINAENGMLGSPQVGEAGVVSVTTLLNGRIIPGRRLTIKSLLVNGDFVARKAQHVGDTWGPEWVTNVVEAKPL